MLLSILLSAGLLHPGLPAGIGEPVCDSLHSVTVTADRGVVVSRTDTLNLDNSFTVSDVLLMSPGLHVGDNGGFGALKTVSLRGMGSAHTTVCVDGVRVGNVQSGQTDLGMLGLENYASAVVDYAQNSISFATARPVFDASPVVGHVRFSSGSFGTYLPSARLDFRLSDRLSLSAAVTGISSRGDFSYGEGQCRTNNGIRQMRAGLDLFGLLEGGDFHAKAYYSGAERGAPGPVSYPSDDRQKDVNAFVQGVVRKSFSRLYSIHVSAKASYDDIFYTSAWGDSRYGQTELQLNSAHHFKINDWWEMSFAADLRWDELKSSNYDASRLTGISVLSSSFRADRLTANVAVEYEGAFDRGGMSRHPFSPSAELRYNICKGFDFIAFGRRAYRIPTFNELYYAGYGNPLLRPEDAWLTDIGVDLHQQRGNGLTLKAKADAFLNFLTDKIISAPTEVDPAIWAPYNIGKVRSAGADALAGVSYSILDWLLSLDVRYSFQSALDMTPDSYDYGRQIPYVARHTAIVEAVMAWKGWTLSPVWHMRAGRTDGTGSLPDLNTLDLNFRKSFNLPKTGPATLRFSLRNLLDCRYETVSGYPMPGRNFMIGIEYKF